MTMSEDMRSVYKSSDPSCRFKRPKQLSEVRKPISYFGESHFNEGNY